MKNIIKYIVYTIFILTTSILHAKIDTVFQYKLYNINQQVNLQQCKYDGSVINSSINVPSGTLIRIRNKISDTVYVVSVANWKENRINKKDTYKANHEKNLQFVYYFVEPEKRKTFLRKHVRNRESGNYIPKKSLPLFFIVSNTYLNHMDSVPQIVSKDSFVAVTITSLPGKMRFGTGSTRYKYPDDTSHFKRTFDVEGSINLGAAAGVKVRLKKNNNDYFFNWVGGASVGTVTVDSASTDGKANSNTKTLAGITPFTGIYFSIKSFQFGVFSGIDFLTGNIGRNWIWRDQPWLGFGIGVSIFSNTNQSSSNQNNK